MVDDDILELGADGTFEIREEVPTAKAKSSNGAVDFEYPADFKFEELPETKADINAVFDSIGRNEYKIFKKEKEITVCVHLNSPVKGSADPRVRVAKNFLVIQSENGEWMKLNISVEVDPASAKARAFDELLVVKLMAM
jgi:hypothetical protein